jgi:23S rRNA pseudouridine955/2504/2580 synthase
MKKVDFRKLIVYENEDYIFINKPSHISSLDDRNDPVNINKLAKEYHADAHVAHRLDKETSGILAIAKNNDAYRNIAIQFEKRQVTKIYHAVADGVHDFDGINVYLPITALSNGTVKIDRQEGKEAETVFYTLKAYKKHTLIECYPLTGRMHQIRIHLSCLKAPIACDPKYGGKPIYLSELKKKYNLKHDEEESPIIQRVALHALSLKFKLINLEELTVEAPYPKDFGVLIKQLEKYD